jgi:hypothetical protein
MALELIHFSMADAVAELRELVEQAFAAGDISGDVARSFPLNEPTEFWRQLASRPAMYLGSESGWHLGWYLAGLTKGGDWLDVPPFPRAEEIADAIHRSSREAYGSDFAGFRVYSGRAGAQRLLGWAGIEPFEVR